MNKYVAKRIVNKLKECLGQEGLEVIGESKEDDMVVLYLREKTGSIFANMSCTYHKVHEVMELSMVTIDTFFQQDMGSILELINLINIAEANNTWSVNPFWNIEIRSAIAVKPDLLNKDQCKRTLKRFMDCSSRVYPAILSQVKDGQTPQDIMDKLVEENRDFFI